MPVDDNLDRSELAADARKLVRRALKGALATLDAETGHPYASLLTLATDAEGQPIFFISTLARHTRNLLADGRASILVDATDGLGNPLEGARVSLIGKAEKIEAEKIAAEDHALVRRFVARHPSAEFYAGFSDFALWRLQLEHAHYVGGFGRILGFSRQEMLTDTKGAEALIAAEPGIVSHMNEDHADAIELYATRLLGAEPGAWRMIGCDPEGCDLLLGGQALRLSFDEPVGSPDQIRKVLVDLVHAARAQAA
jgi:putative heme iron utilization protein